MNYLTVETTVKAPIEKVWEYWNKPEHITRWAFASDDWEAPKAENDLKVGGKFTTTMSAKDKSESFDFTGVYTVVKEHKAIEYKMDDGRHVKIEFIQNSDGIKVSESFEPEDQNPEQMQQEGWQAILDNFKKHVESAV